MMLNRILYIALLSILAAPDYAAADFEISAADRRQVIDRTAALIEGRYVYPERGRNLAEQLRSDADSGRWRALDDPEAFAEAVTRRLRELSGDGHLGLDYSEEALAEDVATAEESYSAAEMERWYGKHLNHGFERHSNSRVGPVYPSETKGNSLNRAMV